MVGLDSTIEQIENWANSGDTAQLVRFLTNLDPKDVAYSVSHADSKTQSSLLKVVANLPALEDVLPELQIKELVGLLGVVQQNKSVNLKQLFSKLDVDDLARILTSLPQDLRGWLADNLHTEDFEKANALLQHQKETAGRIMSPHFIQVDQDQTVAEVLETLLHRTEVEMVYYLYVVNTQQKLTGVVSLRDLLSTKRSAQLSEIMVQDVKFVKVDQDQEEVAKLVERYNISAMPVVDKQHRVVGIVTVDDVIDIIRTETTEDIMKFAGTDGTEYSHTSPLQSFMRRVPWLLVAFLGGIGITQFMSVFVSQINNEKLLYFIPIIVGMGGNLGTQASTIVVRGLAIGKIHTKKLWTVLWREVLTGVLLGLFFAVLLALVAGWQFDLMAAASLMPAGGLFFSMVIAAFIGAAMPILFQALSIDPAVATGPFILSMIDNLGLVGYFLSISVVTVLLL